MSFRGPILGQPETRIAGTVCNSAARAGHDMQENDIFLIAPCCPPSAANSAGFPLFHACQVRAIPNQLPLRAQELTWFRGAWIRLRSMGASTVCVIAATATKVTKHVLVLIPAPSSLTVTSFKWMDRGRWRIGSTVFPAGTLSPMNLIGIPCP